MAAKNTSSSTFIHLNHSRADNTLCVSQLRREPSCDDMLARLYPNLELAQAKSSLRYRVASMEQAQEEDKQAEWSSRPNSPPRRRRQVLVLDKLESNSTENAQQRRRFRHDVPEVPSTQPSVLLSDNLDPLAHAPMLHTGKLDKINQILLRAELPTHRGSPINRPNALGSPQRVPGPVLRPFTSSEAKRKVEYLMHRHDRRKQSPSKDDEDDNSTGSPPSRRPNLASPTLRRSRSKYHINIGESGASAPPLAPIEHKKREDATSKTLALVDEINPRRGSTMSRLGKHLRRVSLVSFEEDEETPESSEKTAARAKTLSASRCHTSGFGLYSIREVMSVIRLFWFLDVDRSDGITLDELGRHRVFFQKLGHSDILAVFHELDHDGNGVILLTELLRVCFPHAKQSQLAAMLTLAKVGNIEDYLENRHATATAETSELNRRQRQVDRQRQELREIFELFDTNGDGRVTLMELLDGLGLEMNRDDEDDLFNFMSSSASSHLSLDHMKRMERARSGGITRADVERFYHAFDKDHDDLLDFDEFVELMETSSERLSLSASEATAEG